MSAVLIAFGAGVLFVLLLMAVGLCADAEGNDPVTTFPNH